MKDDAVYLRHVLECIRRIEENTSAGWVDFARTHTLQDAVLRNLQTMAESMQRLSEELKAARADIEWRRIGAFRNVLVHDYLGVDLERVWSIVTNDVPQLKAAIQELLSAGH